MKLHSLDLFEINVIQTGWDSNWKRKVERSEIMKCVKNNNNFLRRDVVVVLIQCLVHLSQGGGEEGGRGCSLLWSTKVVHIARGSLVSLHLPLDFSVCCLPWQGVQIHYGLVVGNG